MSSSLYYPNASEAIDWLCRAFGFEIRLKVEGEGGRIEHSELTFGDGLVMVADASRKEKWPSIRSPSEVGGGNTQNIFIYVDDVEAHCKRARDAGGKITYEPATSDYGEDYWSDRSYACMDPGGHVWWFAQRMRTGKG
jgi:uncharacterized glyoxalase superfamily protein PhnB